MEVGRFVKICRFFLKIFRIFFGYVKILLYLCGVRIYHITIYEIRVFIINCNVIWEKAVLTIYKPFPFFCLTLMKDSE